MPIYRVDPECARDAILKFRILNPSIVARLLESSDKGKSLKVFEEFWIGNDGRMEYQCGKTGIIQIKASMSNGAKVFRIELDKDCLDIEGLDFASLFGYEAPASSPAISIENFC